MEIRENWTTNADGTSEDFDMVICATGFHVSFPFLPPGLVPVQGSNALLYGGCTLPDYKNLYIVGTPQVRYGFGPLITPAAAMIGELIKLQDEMELPIGLVLKESGAKPPTTHLLDPHRALRQLKLAKYTLPLLRRKERKLRQRLKPSTAILPNNLRTVQPDFEPKVF